MPPEFNAKWEYYVPDEEVAEALDNDDQAKLSAFEQFYPAVIEVKCKEAALRSARVKVFVKLYYEGRFTIKQIAALLQVSPNTAYSWVYRYIKHKRKEAVPRPRPKSTRWAELEGELRLVTRGVTG